MLSPIELVQLVQLSDLDSSLELSGLFDCGELLSDEGNKASQLETTCHSLHSRTHTR